MDRRANRHVPRLTIGAIGITSTVTGIVMMVKMSHYSSIMERALSDHNHLKEYPDAQKGYNRSKNLRNIFIGIGLLSGTGIALTYLF